MTDQRHLIDAAIARLGKTVAAVVSAVDPVNYAVKALVQPDNVETGWMPIRALQIGDLRVCAPPEIGTHVVLEPLEGDQENFVLAGALCDAVVNAPTSPATGKPAQSGEMLIMAGCGAPPQQSGGQAGQPTQDAPWWHITPSALYAGAGDVQRALTSQGETWTIGGMTLSITSVGLSVQGGDIVTNQNVTAQGVVTGEQDVKTSEHSLDGHIHSNGNDGQDTGGPIG